MDLPHPQEGLDSSTLGSSSLCEFTVALDPGGGIAVTTQLLGPASIPQEQRTKHGKGESEKGPGNSDCMKASCKNCTEVQPGELMNLLRLLVAEVGVPQISSTAPSLVPWVVYRQ